MAKLFSKIKMMAFIIASMISVVLMNNATASPDVLTRVLDKGVLVVGMTGEQPPFNAVSRSEDIIGYDADLANALASAMEVELEIVKLPFAQLITSLKSGKVDLIISGMAITPSRTKEVTFVGPYSISGKSLLTTKTVMDKGEGYNNESTRIVALKASTSVTLAKKRLPKAKLTTIDNYEEGIKLILAGKADALLADMPVCKLAVLRNPTSDLMTLKKPLSIEPVGIAIAKNDPQFENFVANYLATLDRVGVTKRLQQKWFENSNWIVALP